jgi:heme-degrading monooxygenase HmoA
VRRSDADAYVAYIGETGLRDYRRTPGNLGAWMLTRDVDDLTQVITFTFWESIEAIKGFAGEDYETAVYYPEDDRYLVERVDTCEHYEVTTADSS